MTEEDVQVVRRALEGFNVRDIDAAVGLFYSQAFSEPADALPAANLEPGPAG